MDEGGLNVYQQSDQKRALFFKKVIAKIEQLYRAKQIQMEELVTMPFGKVLLSN